MPSLLVIVSFFKFLRRGVDGKHLMRFQNKTSVLKFLGVLRTGSITNSVNSENGNRKYKHINRFHKILVIVNG